MVISRWVSSFENRTILVEDIYGESVKIPEGYEYVGFRIPEVGELYLLGDIICGLITPPYDGAKGPKIIIRRTTTIKEAPMTPYKKCFTKTWTIKEIYGVENPVIPEGFEVTEFRIPNINEYYRSVRYPEVPQIFLIKSQTELEPRLILRKKKKLYAKIPLISFIRKEASTYVQFKDVADVYWRINLNKDVEIIEE